MKQYVVETVEHVKRYAEQVWHWVLNYDLSAFIDWLYMIKKAVLNAAPYLNEYIAFIEAHKVLVGIFLVACYLVRRLFKRYQSTHAPPRHFANKQSVARNRQARKWLKAFRRKAKKLNNAQLSRLYQKTDPYLFEEIVICAFQSKGLKVRRTPLSNDGGSDGYVRLPIGWCIIQTKRYSGAIATKDVHKLHKTARSTKYLRGGIFVYAGRASKPVKRYAKQHTDLEMVGDARLLNLLLGKKVRCFGKVL